MDGWSLLYARILLVAAIALAIMHIFGLYYVTDGLPRQLMPSLYAHQDAKHCITVSRRTISIV
jgi:hypothetical protein